MALIDCEDCGAEVSTKADTCPQCGCPVRDGGEPDPDVEPDERSRMDEQDSKSYLLGLYCAVFVLDFPFLLMLFTSLDGGRGMSMDGNTLLAYFLTLAVNGVAVFWSISVLTAFRFDRTSVTIAVATMLCVGFHLMLLASLLSLQIP